jgi:hypothetical protein
MPNMPQNSIAHLMHACDLGLFCALCVGFGVWIGTDLRCVALLCAVYVRLRLVLFPAGGPFLPSLSEKYIFLFYNYNITTHYITIHAYLKEEVAHPKVHIQGFAQGQANLPRYLLIDLNAFSYLHDGTLYSYPCCNARKARKRLLTRAALAEHPKKPGR